MTRQHILMLCAMGAYMLVMLLVGVWYARRNKTADDYYLGGRKLSPLVAAMSAEASDMSSWLLMGLPGLAYLSGVSEAAWTAIGLAVGTYINWLVVARRMRRYTVVANNSITIPDFFSNRFHDKSRLLMSASAIIILIFFVPYTASGFAACGKLFGTIFGMEYLPAMLVSALVLVLYTAIGGFLAASFTDLIQSILMSVALIVVLIFGVVTAGGFGAVIDNANSMPGFLNIFENYLPASNTSEPYGFLTIVSTLAWGLGYFGMPHILLRFMAINDEKKLKQSRRIASIWVVISLGVAICIGVVGAAALKGAFSTSAESETIFIRIAEMLGRNGVFPALFAGVILAGILAATMSTADSQLLVASSSVSQNFYKGLIRKKASNKEVMWVSRITIVVIAVIAAVIALDPNSSIFEIVSFAWAGFGAAFGPLVLFALFWKRTTTAGAFAGMISGGAMVFIWKFLLNPLGGIWAIYELLPAFVLACVVTVAVSLLTKKPSAEIEAEFDLVASGEPVE